MPRLGADSQAWARELRRIEDLGFHAVGVSEHFTHGWAMDALTAMNFALAATSRLRALPLVLTNDLHHPALLAKAVATAGALSGGRAGVGIGAGWLAGDYRALGGALEPSRAPLTPARPPSSPGLASSRRSLWSPRPRRPPGGRGPAYSSPATTSASG